MNLKYLWFLCIIAAVNIPYNSIGSLKRKAVEEAEKVAGKRSRPVSTRLAALFGQLPNNFVARSMREYGLVQKAVKDRMEKAAREMEFWGDKAYQLSHTSLDRRSQERTKEVYYLAYKRLNY